MVDAHPDNRWNVIQAWTVLVDKLKRNSELKKNWKLKVESWIFAILSLTWAVFNIFGAIACLLFDRELLLFSIDGFRDDEFCFSSNLGVGKENI